MQQRKKIITKILFLIIAVPPAILCWGILLLSSTNIDINFGPQLSEKTVLSLSDNLSNLEITGKSNFKNDKFHLKLYKCEACNLKNKTIVYIYYENIFSNPVDMSKVKFYYDVIDNCTRYYEISYNSKTNKALCIHGKISRTNPFSAKIIKTNN